MLKCVCNVYHIIACRSVFVMCIISLLVEVCLQCVSHHCLLKCVCNMSHIIACRSVFVMCIISLLVEVCL